MTGAVRAGGYGALVIFAAFLMHNLNAWYIEPNYLGFEDPMTDYADVAKLRNAMGSWPWMLSGLGHFLSGFGAILVGMACHDLFASMRPVAARLGLAAGHIAGAGFLLTGIADMMGGQAMALLAGQNPASVDAIYLAGSLTRIAFNGLAIVAFGWLALELSWCGLRTGMLPRAFAFFGVLAGLTGFVLAFAYIPVYLSVYLVYSLWLGVTLLRSAASA